MSKIIGGPLSSGVISQLNLRRDKYGKLEDRTNDDLQYISSKTGWVKLTSGVNIKGSNETAKQYILIGGTYGRFGDEAYSTFGGNTGKGFRPMPGINQVQVRSIGKFGTLKEATVTFNCWDVDQLTNLELLYMRPGFTALLEWGHSLYFTTSDNLTKSPSTVSQMIQGGTGVNKQFIYNKIEELRESSAYNYDGIFGFIKNFSWSFRPDGGYDCTTNIVSIGELIESLTVDTDISSNTTNNTTAASGSEILPATMIENVMKAFVDNPTGPDIDGKFPDFYNKFIEVNNNSIPGRVITRSPITMLGTATDTTAGEVSNFVWIRMKDLCGYINAAILIDNTEKNVIKLNTNLSRSSKFKTFSRQVSSDPRICIIAGPGADYWYGNLPSGTNIVKFINDNIDNTGVDEILNIYVNAHFVAEVMTSLRDQPKESRTLVNLIQPILQGISEALGGVNNFDLHYEEETFTYYIVDRQLERTKNENSNLPTLSITGINSTVTQFNFTTKLSPAITNMLAISAQASGADVGIEAEALLTWNRGLKDRIISQRKQRVNEGDKEEISAERTSAQSERVTNIMIGFTSFWTDTAQYVKDQIDTSKTNFTQYATTHVQYFEESKTPAGIIPFEVGIQMDGISGIKIGQAFKINDGIMPKYYNGVVGFIVTGIDHDIQNNRWVTNLKAQTIVIGQGKGKTVAPVEESKGIPKTKVRGTAGGSGAKTVPAEPCKKCGQASGNHCKEEWNVDKVFPKSVKWYGPAPVVIQATNLPTVKINLDSQPLVSYKKTIVTAEQFIKEAEIIIEKIAPGATKEQKKQVLISAFAISRSEQGYGKTGFKGFNNNISGVESSGFSVFNGTDVVGKVQLKEGGTGKMKNYYAFKSLGAGLVPSISKIMDRNMWAVKGTANEWAWRYFRDWNGYGARTLPSYRKHYDDCKIISSNESKYNLALQQVNLYSKYK